MKHQELTNLWWSWQKTNKVLRFGQFVMNNVSEIKSPNPELFYETDPQKAFAIATLLCEDIQADSV